MRKRTMIALALGTLLAGLAGGIGVDLVLIAMNPGVKGPHVGDDALGLGFCVGAFGGGALVVVGRRWWTTRRRPPEQ